MLRAAFVLLAGLLIVACPSAGRPATDAPPPVDAEIDALDAWPLPTVDAAPPPTVACEATTMPCQLPPSECLDARYLLYYTAATCEAGTCQYTRMMLYCPSRCESGGCGGGFT